MTAWQKPAIQEIPVDFILRNITNYQKETIILKFAIFNYVEGRVKKSKNMAFEELAEITSLSFRRVKSIYIEIQRKNQNK